MENKRISSCAFLELLMYVINTNQNFGTSPSDDTIEMFFDVGEIIDMKLHFCLNGLLNKRLTALYYTKNEFEMIDDTYMKFQNNITKTNLDGDTILYMIIDSQIDDIKNVLHISYSKNELIKKYVILCIDTKCKENDSVMDERIKSNYILIENNVLKEEIREKTELLDDAMCELEETRKQMKLKNQEYNRICNESMQLLSIQNTAMNDNKDLIRQNKELSSRCDELLKENRQLLEELDSLKKRRRFCL